MGIYSREYLRRDPGLRRTVVYWIIGLTVAVYVVQGVLLGRGEIDLARLFGVVPDRLIGRGWVWQLVTHVLLHEPYGVLHLAFNMIFLYWLGVDSAPRARPPARSSTKRAAPRARTAPPAWTATATAGATSSRA